MQFACRVYFDFASADVWTFFRFLAAAAADGVELRTDWRPFIPGPESHGLMPPLAAYEAVRDRDPDRHGNFLLALLTAVHVEGKDPCDATTLAAAGELAGVDPGAIEAAGDYAEAVLASTAEARELGVSTTPSLYRHGPVLHVVVTPAALRGDAAARLQTIDVVLDDDAIWTLEKP
jgi:2-hydroxychromene-2-carboxylate isomerase